MVCLTSSEAVGQAYDPEIQREFVRGAAQLQAGDLESAERTFRDVLRKTNSPRVKLELARTLFLLRRYAESRALFREVLLDPDVPWRVRDNVEAFLRQIDEAEGYARFSLSVVSDSNPRNITSQREFTIGGFRLTFVPPADNKRVTGVRYGLQAMQPLDRESGFSAYLTGSYIDYPNTTFDRLTADFGLAKRVDRAGRASVRVGMEAGTFGGRELYEFPYLGAAYVVSQSPVHRIIVEGRVGHVRFPDFAFLDARYNSAAVSGLRSLGNLASVSLNVTVERSDAQERAFAYTGTSIGPGISWLITEPALLVKLDFSHGKRDYGDVDPFFGEKRSDRKERWELSLRSKQWRIFNLSPALILSAERNRSTVDFYSYDKVNASVALE